MIAAGSRDAPPALWATARLGVGTATPAGKAFEGVAAIGGRRRLAGPKDRGEGTFGSMAPPAGVYQAHRRGHSGGVEKIPAPAEIGFHIGMEIRRAESGVRTVI